MPIAKTVRVGIIGGGFSGLAAARYLLSHNANDAVFDVTVFEARDRLGGRAYTSTSFGVPIDLGCSWIHGTQDNPIFKLAQDYNIPVSGETMANKVCIDTTTGKKVEDNEFMHSRMIYEKILHASKYCASQTEDYGMPLESTLFTYLNNYRSELFAGLPVKAVAESASSDLKIDAQAATENTSFALSAAGDTQSNDCVINSQSASENTSFTLSGDSADSSENEEKRANREKMVVLFMFLEQLIHAAKLNEISVLGWSKYKEYEGDQAMFFKGYTSLINALAASIFHEDAPSAGSSPNPATVLPRKARLLISTPVTSLNYDNPDKISVTTKKGESYDFDHVIVTLPLGVLKTKQVKFNPPLLLFKQNAIDNMGFGVVEKIVMKFKNRFWGTANLTGALPTSDFGNEFLTFVSLADIVGEPVLLAFVPGLFAKILQRMEREKVEELVMKRLREMFPDSAENPTDLMVTRWYEDEFSRGSYSYASVRGSYRDIENLMEPIQTRFGVPRVMFAGEATDPVYYGTTHAAFVSGEREGKRLVDSLLNNNTPNFQK